MMGVMVILDLFNICCKSSCLCKMVALKCLLDCLFPMEEPETNSSFSYRVFSLFSDRVVGECNSRNARQRTV